MNADRQYANETQEFLERMRHVTATKEEFYDGLRAALEELEIELQACKETM